MAGPKVDWEFMFVCTLALSVYVNTLGHGLVYDDNRAILTNPDVQASSSLLQVFQNDFWGTPLSSSNSHGSYRPLCVLSFRLNHWLSGFNPFGFHLTNVLLHVLATGLVLATSRTLLPARSPLLAAALFAVHPIHVEAVAGVVGRADVLASVFFLCSFLCYVKHVKVRDSKVVPNVSNTTEYVIKKNYRILNRSKKYTDSLCTSSDSCELRRLMPRGEQFYFAGFVISAVGAVLCKEPGITVIPLAVCYDLILHLRSKRFSSFKPYITASASASVMSFLVIAVIRLSVTGLHSPVFSKADNPTAKEPSLLTRTLTFLYLPLFNLLLLVWPQTLSFDWSMDTIPRVSSLLDIRSVMSASFYYVLYRSVRLCCASSKSQQSRTHSKPQVCKVCTLDSGEEHFLSCKVVNNNNVPLECNCSNPSQRPLPKGSVVTMCLAFTALPFLLASNLLFYVGFVVAERVLYLSSIGFCMLVAVGVRTLMTHSNKSLVVGGFVLLVVALTARTVQRNKDWRDEESLYRSAVHINPPKAYGNLGSVLSSSGRLEEAEVALRLALQHRPNMAEVHYNLGNLLNRQQKQREAVVSYQLAIQYRPSLAVAYLNLGQALESEDRWPEVESVYRKCCLLDVSGLKDPRSHEVARASCLQRLRALCGVRRCHQESAHVIDDLMQGPKGEHYLKVSEHSLTAPTVTEFVHGAAPANKTRVSEKEEMLIRALRKSPSDPQAYINYGQLLVRLGRVSEAASVYLKAARLAPTQHALVTSAAIALRQANRLSEAEVLYSQARDLRPMDASSHSNLGAILHLQGKYREAATSYRESLRLSPQDQVTLANLQKLRNLLSRNKR